MGLISGIRGWLDGQQAPKREHERRMHLAGGGEQCAADLPPRYMAHLGCVLGGGTVLPRVASFLSEFTVYDRTDALTVLSRIPTLVLCGCSDLMTPPSHSVAMAAAVEYSDLVIVEGAGHSVILEQPDQVADATNRLMARAGDPGQVAAAHLTLVAQRQQPVGQQ
ncbi:alpha/beta fold hydrolase, partial [Nocardia brevicatena]|uniref:alpha/beta fold hydrolase n=1 Tax=Nocardia brevicatena TaxID=37327 RepID=UPI0012FB6F98